MMVVIQFDTQMPQHASPCERPVIQMMVDLLLEDDGQVSIWDGEELVVSGSRSKTHILGNLSHTEMDQVEWYDKSGNTKGWFLLIYNNGSSSDGPMVVISDYSANDYCDGVYSKLSEVFD